MGKLIPRISALSERIAELFHITNTDKHRPNCNCSKRRLINKPRAVGPPEENESGFC